MHEGVTKVHVGGGHDVHGGWLNETPNEETRAAPSAGEGRVTRGIDLCHASVARRQLGQSRELLPFTRTFWAPFSPPQAFS